MEQSAVQRYLEGKASLFDRWQIDTRKLWQHTLDQILSLALKDNVLIRGGVCFKGSTVSYACGRARRWHYACAL